MDDLFGLMQPQQQPMAAQPDPGLKAEWDSWLSNPANKTALLSFGLNLMAPTWGNSMVNAVGAAAETYGGIGQMQQAEQQRQQAIGLKTSENEAERNLRRELNTADNEAAMARTKYSSDAVTSRVAGKGTGYSKGAQALFNKTYNDTIKRLTDPLINSEPLTDEEAALEAAAAAASAADAFEGRFGASEAANGAGTAVPGGSTSVISAPGDGQGGSAPSAGSPPAAPGKAPKTVAQTPPAKQKQEAWKVVDNTDPAKLQEVLKLPNADQVLMESFGLTKAEIEAELNRPSRKHGKAAKTFFERLISGPNGTFTK